MDIQSERLAYWYLRLNGFLTIPNFVVHPDAGSNQETEVDVLGVRFPYRAENLENPMVDDDHFPKVRDKPSVIIAEVKTRRQDPFNPSWTNPERQNMLRIVRAIGTFPESDCDLVARALYDKGWYQNNLYYMSLLWFGQEHNNNVAEDYPDVPQILWLEVLGFIYRRFHKYRNQKVSHKQWDTTGQKLWNIYQQSGDERQFKENICVCS